MKADGRLTDKAIMTIARSVGLDVGRLERDMETPKVLNVIGNNRRLATALAIDGNTLKVFYTNAADSPERIFLSTIDIGGDWSQWKASDPVPVLEPETEYEGADLQPAPSARGAILERVRQLRDPGIYRENGKTYLLYSVAGEQGIAIATLEED